MKRAAIRPACRPVAEMGSGGRELIGVATLTGRPIELAGPEDGAYSRPRGNALTASSARLSCDESGFAFQIMLKLAQVLPDIRPMGGSGTYPPSPPQAARMARAPRVPLDLAAGSRGLGFTVLDGFAAVGKKRAA